MRISLTSPNISGNCVGRSYLLAKALQEQHQVEIVGPMFGSGVWAPVADDSSISYKFVKFNGIQIFNIFKWLKLLKKMDGDIIYAHKPLFTSVAPAFIKSLLTKKPFVVDIDDWEAGFLINKAKSRNIRTKISSLAHFFNVMPGLLLTKASDKITVSNSFLQKKYGGKIIVHARDTKIFDPKNYNRNKIRDELSIPKDKTVISFIGTPLPYKGVESLVEAFKIIEIENEYLLIVGLGNDTFSKKIKKIVENNLNEENYKLLGKQSFEQIPKFVAISDIFVIPQKKNIATQGQLPAKLFDAMCLEIPIITTKVGDIPEILSENGWYFEPGNANQLKETIKFVIKNYKTAKLKAKKSREDCVNHYSLKSIGAKLNQIMQDLSPTQ